MLPGVRCIAQACSLHFTLPHRNHASIRTRPNVSVYRSFAHEMEAKLVLVLRVAVIARGTYRKQTGKLTDQRP